MSVAGSKFRSSREKSDLMSDNPPWWLFSALKNKVKYYLNLYLQYYTIFKISFLQFFWKGIWLSSMAYNTQARKTYAAKGLPFFRAMQKVYLY